MSHKTPPCSVPHVLVPCPDGAKSVIDSIGLVAIHMYIYNIETNKIKK